MTDILLTPMAVEQEYNILNLVLREDYPADDFIAKLNEDDFALDDNKYIYSVIKSLVARKKSVNCESVGNYMKDRQHKREIPVITLEKIIKNYWCIFYDSIITILKEKSSRRRLLTLTSEIESLIKNPDNETDYIINAISQLISKIDSSKNDIAVHDFYDVLKKRYYELEDSVTNKTFKHGIYCGIKCIDDMTGGFNEGELIIIGARPSMGKSALMMNMAINMACDMKDSVVLVISIEMKKEPLADRAFSSVGFVDQNVIKYGHVNNGHLMQYSNIFDAVHTDRLFIVDKPAISVSQIKSIIRRFQKSKGVNMVFIDYMGKIRYSNQRSDEYEGITQVSGDLKETARDLNIPVVCLAQLNRDCEKRPTRRPMMSDLKASGAIEADADFIGLLYRPGYYGEDELKRLKYDNDNSVAELVVAKSRTGTTGTAFMTWLSEYSLFTSR